VIVMVFVALLGAAAWWTIDASRPLVADPG
jgi:hypothetical protein